MRRTLLALTLLAALGVAAFGFAGPSSAQVEEVAFLNITKVVDGDGPTGGYVIEYSCDIETDSSPAEGGGSGVGGSLAFDAAGPGSPETQTIELNGPGNCIVTETDSNGATTVTYACEYVPGQLGAPDGESAFGEGKIIGGCIDDQSGTIQSPQDQLNITVTNTFEPEVLPDDDEPPAVQPGVVNASPSFTG